MKSVFIVTILLFLIACSDDKTKEIKSTESIKHQVKVEPVIERQDDRISIKVINNGEEPSIAVLENKQNINFEPANNTQEKITCLGQTLNDWYTFDETLEKPSCKKMNNIGKINNYQCSVEEKVFGSDFEVIRITVQGNRIFAFQTLDQCNEALEMWEANAY
ncbi:hypothetical protein GPS57_16315 [Acinetobacter haemolyticus]|uniref:hypothetical protein n=1 Tax=Acinetobacter haemolyticus TaxID=29430 RepID=UPI001372E73C|nr:hypothetical protein [Acinetobacter haemolyticus]NAR65294.1 hypothetical protein [Acinetobacter haemolyticus]